jgi:Ca2+-transporting ATPase
MGRAQNSPTPCGISRFSGTIGDAAAAAANPAGPVEAGAIAAVLAINTVTGFVTEMRARRAMAALVELDVPRAFVVRHGHLRAVDAYVLVPGDVVEMNAGRHVPADGRLLEEWDLRVDEAALTGESLPVSKSTSVLPADTPLAERARFAHVRTGQVARTNVTASARFFVDAGDFAREESGTGASDRDRTV